ncbi:TVP38/TMEM64 family inner membrane protein YdjZ [Corynebacterium choanae]|uniref:TVP38/TMEM64 family membrane protein n=1 Tax=Corynebacterium choanae TaxID=1862358 RepID=A0A3G6J667_9CORY|nr:TVP38/TMEM64 family inner membrane protein YdjZ [Corynebacterium choanae]
MAAGAAVILVTTTVRLPGLEDLRAYATATGPWFPVLFLLGYILLTQFPIPRTIFTLSAGIIFGPVLGIVIVLTGTTISAALSLTMVRYLLRDAIAPLLTHPAVDTINARLQRRGWLAIISLRMIAAVPFSILNYCAALTAVPVSMFALGTLLGSAPGSIATVVIGDALLGHTDPRLLLITVALFILGSAGLYLDQKLPVNQQDTAAHSDKPDHPA